MEICINFKKILCKKFAHYKEGQSVFSLKYLNYWFRFFAFKGMWAKLNRFVDAVEVDGKFKYYNEVKQNPNQHYEILHNLSKNYINLFRDFFLTYNIWISE